MFTLSDMYGVLPDHVDPTGVYFLRLEPLSII